MYDVKSFKPIFEGTSWIDIIIGTIVGAIFTFSFFHLPRPEQKTPATETEVDRYCAAAEVLLTSHLRTQGLLASDVKCGFFVPTLYPQCTASVQPTSGGPVSKGRYTARTELPWQTY